MPRNAKTARAGGQGGPGVVIDVHDNTPTIPRITDDPPRPDPDAIREFTTRHFEADCVYECRMPNTRRGPARLFQTASGYFDDPDALATALKNITGKDAEAVYVTLNPVQPDLMARAVNRIKSQAKSTASDTQITRRQRIIFDIDPTRSSDISATDAERDAALSVRDAIRKFLTDNGWSEPLVAGMSGNGGNLIYRVNLPNNEEATALVAAVLNGLAERFNTEHVTVDTTMHNASRITKIPGTVAAKGDHTDLRPWRVAYAEYPENPGVVTAEQLQGIAVFEAPPEPKQAKRTLGTVGYTPRTWTMEDVLRLNDLSANPKPWNGGTAYELPHCLTSDDHLDGARLFEGANGELGYRCHHNSCEGKDWNYLRQHELIKIPGQPAYNAPVTTRNGHAEEVLSVSSVISGGVSPQTAFPVDVFPEPFRTFVKQATANLDCPADLVAVPMLALIAGVIGNGYEMLIKKGWIERAILWIVVVAGPGAAKTPALKVAMEPVSQLQTAAFEEFRYRMEEYERDVEEYEKTKKHKGTPTPDKPQKPELEHFFTTDSTVEALARILGHDDGITPGVTMLRDEIVGWIRSFDAYRQAGDRQAWMSFWAGVSTKVDRASKDTAFIPRPAVSVTGGIQPDLLPRLEEEAGLRDGFLDRFLFAFPDTRPMRFTDDTGDDTASESVRRALSDLRSHRDVRQVVLSPEAKQAFRDFYDGNATEQEHCTGLVQGYLAKLPSQLARLALILHCMTHPKNPDTVNVSAETMYRAITLTAYFQQNALKVFERFGIAAQVQDPLAPRIVRAIEAHGGSVTTSELNELLGGHVKANDRDHALELLESAGMIEREAIPTGERGGRPGYRFVLRDTPPDKTDTTDKTPDSGNQQLCRNCGNPPNPGQQLGLHGECLDCIMERTR